MQEVVRAVSESHVQRRAQETRISLIDSLKIGQSVGWSRLLRLYRPSIVFWARRNGVSVSDLDDVCQDVCRVVTERIDEFRRHQIGSFRCWLREITRRVCLEQARTCPRSLCGSGGSEALLRLRELPEMEFSEDDPQEQIADLLERTVALIRSEFSECDWQVYSLLSYDQQSPRQVATALQLSEANVRQVKSRIYRRLREELGDVRRQN